MKEGPARREGDGGGDERGALVVGLVEWTVPSSDGDQACGLMADLAPQGFEMVDDATLDLVPADQVMLRAYVPVDAMDRLAHDLAAGADALMQSGAMQESGRVAARVVEQSDWVAEVRKGFTPLTVARFRIRPPWSDAEAGDERSGSAGPGSLVDRVDPVDLVVLPGAAFGTGRHPTTRLCLAALDALAETQKTPERLLDLGTGSGLLALAAARLWPNLDVTACEPDPDALDSCRDNLRLNHLESRIQATADCSLPGRTFDMVVANIRLDTLLSYVDAFAQWLEPGGLLLLSGLLQEETETMLSGLGRVGRWDLLSESREEEWSCLVLRANGR